MAFHGYFPLGSDDQVLKIYLNSKTCINQVLVVTALRRGMVLDKVALVSEAVSEEANSTSNSWDSKAMHEGDLHNISQYLPLSTDYASLISTQH